MCFLIEHPPHTNPTWRGSLYDKMSTYEAYLRDLGHRFPQKPRLMYDVTPGLAMCHAWLVEAAEYWVPELYPKTECVVYVNQRDIVDIYDIITPSPTRHGDARALLKRVRNTRRSADQFSKNRLVTDVTLLLDYFPPSDAFTWLVSHNLVPVIPDRVWSYRGDPDDWIPGSTFSWSHPFPTTVMLVSLYNPVVEAPYELQRAMAAFGK